MAQRGREVRGKPRLRYGPIGVRPPPAVLEHRLIAKAENPLGHQDRELSRLGGEKIRGSKNPELREELEQRMCIKGRVVPRAAAWGQHCVGLGEPAQVSRETPGTSAAADAGSAPPQGREGGPRSWGRPAGDSSGTLYSQVKLGKSMKLLELSFSVGTSRRNGFWVRGG